MLKATAAEWLYDSWEQTAADLSCLTLFLRLTFSKNPVPTGISDDTTNGSLGHKVTSFVAYTLHFITCSCLFCRLL